MHERGCHGLFGKRRCLELVMEWAVAAATLRPWMPALTMASVDQTPGQSRPGGQRARRLPPECWARAPCLPGERGQPGFLPGLGPAWAAAGGHQLSWVSPGGFDGADDKRSENSVGPCNQGQR